MTDPTPRQTLASRLGLASTGALPERIQNYIRERQDASEIVIGWVQLAVVIVFGLLFAVAPKPESASDWQPAPWVLGLYFGFTLLRLSLAYRRKLPNWMLVLSIVFDIGLLMVLIWSFHLDYNQPPSFYLKAPTLLYVFVFIALRALRFDATYVLIAGAVAAFGWLSLFGYALREAAMTGANPMVTRDYVDYMTSNNILVGAEIDKAISIIVVTLILAFAVARARGALVQATAQQSAADELSRFVPSEVVQAVLASEDSVRAGQGEQNDATIMFIDIEGFTRIGESLSPERLVQTLNEYFAAVCEPIRELDGVVTQFQGDAILASFNVPKANSDHAANAVRAGIRIIELLATRRFGEDVTLCSRIGITSGSVIGGLVGTADRVDYTVHGDIVNLAARLEQKNKELGTRLLVSGSTLSRVEDDAALRDRFYALGPIEIRGHREPVDVFSLNISKDDA